MEYADGHLFFGDKGSLFAQPFDVQKLALSGERFRVADDLGFSFGDISAYAFSVSPRGTLVYWSGRSVAQTQLTWFSRAGQRPGTVGEPGEIIGFASSPTNQEVVLERHDPKRDELNLWRLEKSTGVASQLSPGLGARSRAGTPVWSFVGDRVFFAAFPGIVAQSLLGGAPERLSDDFAWLMDISPDGRYALWATNDPVTIVDMWLVPLRGDRAPKPYMVTRRVNSLGAFRPTGTGWPTGPTSPDARKCMCTPFRSPAARCASPTTEARGWSGAATAGNSTTARRTTC